MSTTEPRPCLLCGTAFDARVGGRGRPQVYCSPVCGEVSSLLGRLETVVLDMALQGTGALPKLAAIRSQLWRIANLLNHAGRPTRKTVREATEGA
jgi:hypothetical protein